MNDYKKRITDAINKFETKHSLVKENVPRRKNETPEKTVEKDVLVWLRKIGCFVNVYDSALQPDAYSGPVRVAARSGTPDLLGCTNEGMFVAIELKAPGRRSTLKEHQREFLIRVIRNNGFACCTDSQSHLKELYNNWARLDIDARIKLLLIDLPVSRKSSQDVPLFDDYE